METLSIKHCINNQLTITIAYGEMNEDKRITLLKYLWIAIIELLRIERYV